MSRRKQPTEQCIAEYAALKGAARAAEALYAALVQGLDAALAQTVRRIESDYAAAVQRATAGLEQARQAAAIALLTGSATYQCDHRRDDLTDDVAGRIIGWCVCLPICRCG